MAQLVKLEPGDTLVLSNLGELGDDMVGALQLLKERLEIAEILVFEGDVDLSKIPRDAS